MKSQYYWMDSDDFSSCGPWNTEADARIDAESCGLDTLRGKTVTILKVVSTSEPPNLNRKWKSL